MEMVGRANPLENASSFPLEILLKLVDAAWIPADAIKSLHSGQKRHANHPVNAAGSHANLFPEIKPQPQLSPSYNLQDRLAARELANRLALLSPLDNQHARSRFPTEPNVSSDLKGMWQLINAKSYQAAVNLSSTLLLQSGALTAVREALEQESSHTATAPSKFEQLMTIWCLRLSCLLLLRDFVTVEFELNSFENLDGAFYFADFSLSEETSAGDGDRYRSVKLSVVPFCMRLLHLQLPLAKLLHGSNVGEDLTTTKQELTRAAFEKLFTVKTIIDTMLTNVCTLNLLYDGRELPKIFASNAKLHANYKSRFAAVWNQRQLAVLNSLLMLSWHSENFTTFYSTFRQILRTLGRLDPSSLDILLCELHLIRFCIRLGDVTSAATLHAHADNLIEHLDSLQNSSQQLRDVLNMHAFNKILILIARDEYSAATTALQSIDGEIADDSIVSRTNAAAVAAFYQGHVAQATSTLEQVMSPSTDDADDRGDQISTTVLFNLSMLYELSGVNVYPRKLALLKYAALNVPESLNVQSLKITPPPPTTFISSSAIQQQPPLPLQQQVSQQFAAVGSGDYRHPLAQ